MDRTEKQKAAVREFTTVFKNEHNVDAIDHLFAPEFKHNFKVPVSPGLEGFKQIGRVMLLLGPTQSGRHDGGAADL